MAINFTSSRGKWVIIERKSDWVIFSDEKYKQKIAHRNPCYIEGALFASKLAYPTFELLKKILE